MFIVAEDLGEVLLGGLAKQDDHCSARSEQRGFDLVPSAAEGSPVGDVLVDRSQPLVQLGLSEGLSSKSASVRLAQRRSMRSHRSPGLKASMSIAGWLKSGSYLDSYWA